MWSGKEEKLRTEEILNIKKKYSLIKRFFEWGLFDHRTDWLDIVEEAS